MILFAALCAIYLNAAAAHIRDQDASIVIVSAEWPAQPGKYEPNWKSLDARPLPEWYDRGKIGIFIHFGVFSVPGFTSEWFWCYWKCPDRIKPSVLQYLKQNYPPGWTYQDFARDFKLEFFDAEKWVSLFEASGARYAVLTSKHHEGYTLWPSKHSFSWNAVDVGPNRDIVGEFAAAVRKSSLRLGLYHSLFEWFNPLYELDKENNFTTRFYPTSKGTAELYELVNNYKPDLIWSDGDAGPVQYWNSTGFLAWLYNESPVKESVVVNDRWGAGTACKHGGFLNCKDRYSPGTRQARKWEDAMTLDKHSWGNRRNMNAEDVLTFRELILTLVKTVSCGGNLLVNVGPTREGIIPAIMQERLLQLGNWLQTNGEAVYDSKLWRASNDTTAYYTSSRDDKHVFAFFMTWPSDEILELSSPIATRSTTVELLDGTNNSKAFLEYVGTSQGVKVKLPSLATVQHLNTCWVLKLSNVQ